MNRHYRRRKSASPRDVSASSGRPWQPAKNTGSRSRTAAIKRWNANSDGRWLGKLPPPKRVPSLASLSLVVLPTGCLLILRRISGSGNYLTATLAEFHKRYGEQLRLERMAPCIGRCGVSIDFQRWLQTKLPSPTPSQPPPTTGRITRAARFGLGVLAPRMLNLSQPEAGAKQRKCKNGGAAFALGRFPLSIQLHHVIEIFVFTDRDLWPTGHAAYDYVVNVADNDVL